MKSRFRRPGTARLLACAAASLLPGVALAQGAGGPVGGTPETPSSGPIGSYVAFIGADDHYNSRGQRLDNAPAILRQDRANFHRFAVRDPGDGDDPFFASADARAAMERQMAIDPETARRIVADNVLVRVEVYDGLIRVTLE